MIIEDASPSSMAIIRYVIIYSMYGVICFPNVGLIQKEQIKKYTTLRLLQVGLHRISQIRSPEMWFKTTTGLKT